MKIVMLDMDGVVNSWKCIHRYYLDKLQQHSGDFDYTYAVRGARKDFSTEFVHGTELIFPELAAHISHIIEETDAYIVWSTSWRVFPPYYRGNIKAAQEMLTRRGIPGDRLIDYTPILPNEYRNGEINAWLRQHPEVTKCAVLDDDPIAGLLLEDRARFFQTDADLGITSEIADKVIDYLKEE